MDLGPLILGTWSFLQLHPPFMVYPPTFSASGNIASTKLTFSTVDLWLADSPKEFTSPCGTHSHLSRLRPLSLACSLPSTDSLCTFLYTVIYVVGILITFDFTTEIILNTYNLWVSLFWVSATNFFEATQTLPEITSTSPKIKCQRGVNGPLNLLLSLHWVAFSCGSLNNTSSLFRLSSNNVLFLLLLLRLPAVSPLHIWVSHTYAALLPYWITSIFYFVCAYHTAVTEL